MEDKSYFFPEINFEKSIKENRLVYILTFNMVLGYIFHYISACFLIVVITIFIIAFSPMIEEVGKANLSNVAVVVCLIAANILIILNLVFLNKFVRVSGRDLESNKNTMKKLLKDMYNDIESADVGENSIKYFRSPDLGQKKRITTLYQGNNVYINITTPGRHISSDLSITHGCLDYLKSKRIAAAFSQKIAAGLKTG